MCWGLGRSGQVGEKPRDGTSQLATITGLGEVSALMAGAVSSCARDVTGLLCWGELGGGATPKPFGVVADAVALAFGSGHNCALRPSGQVTCWGINLVGQLGNGKAPDPKTKVAMRVSTRSVEVLQPMPAGSFGAPGNVTGLSDAVQLVAGSSHTCARRRGGQVVCWGSGSLDQLSDSSALESSDHPIAIKIATPGGLTELTGVADLRAGNSYTCARRTSGEVLCWGSLSDKYGPNPVIVKPAVELPALKGSVAMAIADNSACAVTPDGKVLCWEAELLPEARSDITQVQQLVAGMRHFCALRRSGQVSCWGEDFEGVLGMNSPEGQRSQPVIPELDKVVELAAGSRHNCARRAGY